MEYSYPGVTRKNLVAACMLAGLALPGMASAATWTVNSDGSGDFPNLPAAMLAVESGDEIQLSGGTFGPVAVIDQAVKITGASGDTPSVLTGLTVGGLNGHLELRAVEIAPDADVVEVRQGSLFMEKVSFRGDDTKRLTPLVSASDSALVTFKNSEISGWKGNDALVVAHGGRLAFDGSYVGKNVNPTGSVVVTDGVVLVVAHSRFEDNVGRFGACLNVKGGRVDIDTSRFFRGTASESGGQIRVEGAEAVNVIESVFEKGHASMSGGAFQLIDVNHVMFANDSFTSSDSPIGGALQILGDTSFEGRDLRFIDNSGEDGAGVEIEDARARFVRLWMRGATAKDGADIYMTGGEVAVQNGIFDQTEVAERGGAIFQEGGQLDVRFSTFASNRADYGAVWYGTEGTANFTGVIIAGNLGLYPLMNEGTAVTGIENSILTHFHSATTSGDVTVAADVLDTNPRFVNPLKSDYSLTLLSPALDALPDFDGLDLDGTVSDMGAYGGPMAWVLPDLDDDGYVHGRDCDDKKAEVNEAATEIWYDGIDENCLGENDFDQDGDGYDLSKDVDDTNPEVHELVPAAAPLRLRHVRH
jgi:hypothetical protein